MTDRTTRIIQLRTEGMTCAQIGAAVGLSKQRVWSILRSEETKALMEQARATLKT